MPVAETGGAEAGRPSAWHVTSRVLSLRGEERANVLRVVGVAVFYSIEVLNYRGLSLGPLTLPSVEGVDASFHAMATALAVAWISLSALVFLALKNRVFPPALKYFTTGSDIFLLTSVLVLADGPRSPVLLVYFLVIALAGLRFNLRLTLFATLGAVLGYTFLVLEVARRREELVVPPHWVVTTLVALVLCGVVVGQILRSARWAVASFSTLHAPPVAASSEEEE